MASPDDVNNYLRGAGWSRTLYQGAKEKLEGYAKPFSDMRDILGELGWNLLRHQDNYDLGRPGVPQPGADDKRTIGLWDGVQRAVFELTLWTAKKSRKELLAKRTDPDTVHGHARDAASAATLALEVALRVADKVGADLSDIEGLDEV